MGDKISSTAVVTFLDLHSNLQEILTDIEVDSILVAGLAPLHLPYLRHLRLDWYTLHRWLATDGERNLMVELLEARKDHSTPFVLQIHYAVQDHPGWREVTHCVEKCGPNVSLEFHMFWGHVVSSRQWMESDM